jgi:hypothetical protein
VTPDSPRGLPNAVIAVVYGVVLLGSLVVAGGVLIANAMSCDSGGDQCATGMVTATLTWAAITFLLPIGALVWGLVSSRETRAGRRNRVIALILILALPIIGLAANLAILFQPAFHE